MRLSQLLLLVTLSVIWGSAFMMVDVILNDVPVMTLVAGRVAGGCLFLISALLLTGRSMPRDFVTWRAIIFLGLVNNCFPFIMLAWGQQRIDSSLAAILVASMPLSVIIIAHFWIHEQITLSRLLGILIGFGGVFVLIGADLRDIAASGTLGQLAVVGGAVGYATGTVFARQHLQNADTLVTATGQTLVATSVMIPVALVIDMPFDISLSARSTLAWAALGVFPSGVAYLIFFQLVRQVSAAQASMVTYLIPVTAVILGVLVLDETISANAIGGFGLIIAGIWVVNDGWRLLGSRFRPRSVVVPDPAVADEPEG